MRYGMCINNDGEQVRGTRGEIRAAVAGVLLAAGHDLKEPTAQEKAEFVLSMADWQADKGKVQGLDLNDDDELTVWRERGDERKNRNYMVRVGDKGSLWQTSDPTILVTYIAGLMVADSAGVERATGLGENVAYALSEGGGYPDNKVTMLRDGRAVYAWWEGEK